MAFAPLRALLCRVEARVGQERRLLPPRPLLNVLLEKLGAARDQLLVMIVVGLRSVVWIWMQSRRFGVTWRPLIRNVLLKIL